MENNMSKEEKAKMIEAMINLKNAASVIANLWEGDGNGESKFDNALEQEYPFNDCFFETYHNIINWANSSIENLK